MKKLFFALLPLLALASCHVTVSGKTTVSYDNADKYSFGNKTYDGPIAKLEVGFVVGDIQIEKGDSLSVSEEGEHEEWNAVHHLFEKDVLNVESTGCGSFSSFDFAKKVTVTVPSDLETLEFGGTSFSATSTVDVKNVDIGGVDATVSITSSTLESIDIGGVGTSVTLVIPEGKKLDIDDGNIIGSIDGDYEKGDDIKIDIGGLACHLKIERIK